MKKDLVLTVSVYSNGSVEVSEPTNPTKTAKSKKKTSSRAGGVYDQIKKSLKGHKRAGRSASEIAEELGMDAVRVRSALMYMSKQGHIQRKERGRYSL